MVWPTGEHSLAADLDAFSLRQGYVGTGHHADPYWPSQMLQSR
jgi:hypothetical protein